MHCFFLIENDEFKYLTELGTVERRNGLNEDLEKEPIPAEFVTLFDYKQEWWFEKPRGPGWSLLIGNVAHVWADPGVKRAATQIGQVLPDGETERMSLKKYAFIIFERLIGGLPGMRRLCSVYHLEKNKRPPGGYVTKFMTKFVGQKPLSKRTATEAKEKTKAQLKSGRVCRLVYAIQGKIKMFKLKQPSSTGSARKAQVHKSVFFFLTTDHLHQIAKGKGLPGLTQLEEKNLETELTRHMTLFGNGEFKRWIDDKKDLAPESEKKFWDSDNVLHPFCKPTFYNTVNCWQDLHLVFVGDFIQS